MKKEQLAMKKDIAAMKAKGQKLWDLEEKKPENRVPKSKKKITMKYKDLWPANEKTKK